MTTRARTTVEIGGHSYVLAMPLGALEEVAAINPYLRRAVADLQGADANIRLARQIVGIALAYGDDPATVEDIYERHGWAALPLLALEALLAGFQGADQVGKPEGDPGTATSPSGSPTGSGLAASSDTGPATCG